jgi:hypothetical protein
MKTRLSTGMDASTTAPWGSVMNSPLRRSMEPAVEGASMNSPGVMAIIIPASVCMSIVKSEVDLAGYTCTGRHAAGKKVQARAAMNLIVEMEMLQVLAERKHVFEGLVGATVSASHERLVARPVQS